MADKDNLDEQPNKRRFINEKIVKPKPTASQLVRRLLFFAFSAALFGAIAAVTFVVSQPLAKRYLTAGESTESTTISIPRDEPESTAPATEPSTETAPEPETELTTAEETQPVEERVREELENYDFSIADLEKMYSSVAELTKEIDKGIVTINSVKTQVDWFNNPVETSGLFAGAVVASAGEYYSILTTIGAVEDADALEVTLADGSVVSGELKSVDPISGFAVIGILSSQLDESMKENINVLELGNSFSVKQSELVIAGGSPAGIVGSYSIGDISYIARNVSVVDGVSRFFYSSVKGNASLGTFLFNTRGQIIGLVTEDHQKEGSEMTAIRGISDYKGILEKMFNNMQAPYFGIMGQEVPEHKREEGMPAGIYVSRTLSESPAYDAGIQNGDIIVEIQDGEITTMRDFQTCIDGLSSGDSVKVVVERYGREDYTPIEFQVTIGAR